MLRGRVDALGVAEPTLARSGDRRIIVELPGLHEPAEAAEVLGRTARLTVHPVLDSAVAAGAEAGTTQAGTLSDEDGRPLSLGPTAPAGEDVTGARAQPAQGGVG